MAFGYLGANLGVGARDFVGKGLPDVVEQAADLGDLDVGPGFGGEHSGQQPHLHRVLQHVLAVAVAILELPQQPDQFAVPSH